MELKLEGSPYDRQIEFFLAKARHIAYGGARGGGKSWAMRRKFILLALRYPKLKLLLLRRTLPELRDNHILPLQEELYNFAKYNDKEKCFVFPNGSRMRLGYCDHEADVFQYQGQEYDVIGMEEATHFTDAQRVALSTCNRTTRKDFKPRMYYTANPGNVGHEWFKRLFIDRDYRGKEKASDYVFIPAKVYDNKILMENNPEYVEILENLPELQKRAFLYGDWDVFEGQYFTEFDRSVHVIEPFEIPPDWRIYRTMDYGLDMLACYWIALAPNTDAYVIKELYEPNLIISDAANGIKTRTMEHVHQTLAPPDLWNRRQDTGRSAAEIFNEHGITLTKSINDRITGWYTLKEWMKPVKIKDEQIGGEKTTAKLKIFSTCPNLIRTLPQLRHDDKVPNDVADEPHELTHAPDAIRYFVATFTKPNKTPKEDIKGTYAYGELKMKGFSDAVIKRLQRQGNIHIIGRKLNNRRSL